MDIHDILYKYQTRLYSSLYLYTIKTYNFFISKDTVIVVISAENEKGAP